MKKLIICITALCIFPVLLWAGGIDNKQNFSANYIGTASRNGTIEGLDTAAYNPAGIIHLKDGLSGALHVQFFSTNYDHTIADKDYGAENYPILPTIFTVYKKNRWAGYGTFTAVGGGGEVEYSEGNAITKTVNNLVAAKMRPASTGFSDQYGYVESYDYAWTAGISYAATEKLSFSAGIRYVLLDKRADLHGILNAYGKNGAILHGQPIIAVYEQDGDGIGGVFGLNYRFSDELNIGIRYETKVKLDWETSVPAESHKQYGFLPVSGAKLLALYNREDKTSYSRDLPGVLGVGLVWDVTDQFSVMPSATLYFEKSADWGEKNSAVDRNSLDLAIAFGYQVNEKLKLTCGYMYTDVGIHPDTFGIIEQMSPPLDGHSFSLGAGYKITDKLSMCVGAMTIIYESDTSHASYLAPNVILAPEITYKKRNYCFGISFEYSFL